MFEDDGRNLEVPHRLGMRTVLVGAGRRPPARPAPHRRPRRLPRAGRLMRARRVRSVERPRRRRRRRRADGGGRLRSAGFRTLCVDPVPPVTCADAEGSDLRSTAFLMPALALLERAGLRDRLAPHAAPLRVMRIVDAGGAAGGVGEERRLRRRGESAPTVFGWNLPNWLLRREMVARLDELPCGRAPRRHARRAGDAANRWGDRRPVRWGPGAGAAGGRGGRSRQRGAARARDRRAALGLRAEGAGLLGRPRPAARGGVDRDPPLGRAVHPGAAARPRRRAAFGGGLDGARARGRRRWRRCPTRPSPRQR